MGAKPKILIVEDDPITRFMMCEICDSLGYRCEQAAVGDQCLEMMKSDPDRACVVLMDIHMPGLSGVETCARLRAAVDPDQRLRIIAVTADEFWQDRSNAAAAGFDGVLCKPISIDVFRRVIDSVATAACCLTM